jgi:signal transduction histidine kinase/DNA-binding response OmpR family regulator/ligand-binding sensor domain-containing protein
MMRSTDRSIHRLTDAFSLLVLILAISRIFSGTAYGQAENYPYKVKSLTVDEGLSHTDANDIAQDQKGFVWIATYFGLDRFDGNSIRQFYNSNEPLKNAYKNRLTCVYPDETGDIWLGTEGGLQRFDVRTEHYIDYQCKNQPLNNFLKIYKPTGNKIYAMGGKQLMLFELKGTSVIELKLPLKADVFVNDFVVDHGRIILATSMGLMMLDEKEHLSQLPVLGLNGPALNHIAFGKAGELLVAAKDQFYIISPTSKTPAGLQSYTVKDRYTSPFHNEVNNVIHDSKDTYWVSEGGALVHLDSRLRLKQVISSKNPQQTLNSSSLTKIFIDRSQCLWICMFGGGVNYFDLNEKPFYTLAHLRGDKNSLSGNYVRSVLADGDDLWVGTTDGGLNCYNRKTRNFGFYNTYDSSVRLKSDVITSLALDHDYNLWIGSYSGIEILDRRRQQILKPSGEDSFPKYAIEVLTTDCFGNIWFGNHTDQFGVIYKDSQGTYHTKYYGEGFFILADKKEPKLMVSSTHGLKRISVDKNGNILNQFTYTASGKANSLSSNYTYPIVKQNDSVYWVGTIGGGLNRLMLRSDNDYSFKTFGKSYGVFNDVESLELDDNGNIWMGGNGLERFNPSSKRLIRYDKNDGLQGNSFKVGSSFKGEDGCLYFGGINGLNYFYPDQIHENSVMAIPRITDILINNQHAILTVDNKSGNSISQSVSYSDELKINYRQNNFVIYFSAMHFANPLKCKYRYRLLGFDKEWRYTDGRNPSAAYNNIDYADYTFQIQASNDDGVWSHETAILKVAVTPPWWKSLAAKIFYSVILLSILIGIYLYQARWHTLKRDIEIAKVNEKKREEIHLQREELHQQQLVFFTNISHEFRTPLTLIVGPLEYLIHENKDVHLDSSYQLIMRNAKRLMNLIAELMNFKKLADSVIKLQVRPLDINQFCNGLFIDFENIALKKDIRYRFINNTGSQTSGLTGWFDVQVLEKILFNLLNNAFKYTESNGEVTLEIFFDLDKFKPSFPNEYKLLNTYRADYYLYIRVADTGIGISPESIGNIFERYYRISSSHIGSGVGLALVKSLAQLHKGDIYVYSERMKGTEIIVGIPWGEINYDDTEKIPIGGEVRNQLEPVDKSLLTAEDSISVDRHAIGATSNQRILIVEDNSELRRFLMQVLDKHYQIYEAGDGEQGLKIATEKVPDIIISDVMMPKMNGIELCRAVKQKFETRHIPFIILSAKNAIDARIEGMELGADFYFAKPLSIDLLLLTVRNIFSQREVAKQRFLNDYLSDATELVQSEVDKDFFDKLIRTIDNNLQDAEMDVDFLCRHLFVSRTKLYQKIKSISGQSVGEFIRTVRLKRSIEIMTHENISMNEVAERIGMQSSSNFSRTFKKEYGKSPLQFMQALKNKQNRPVM